MFGNLSHATNTVTFPLRAKLKHPSQSYSPEMFLFASAVKEHGIYPFRTNDYNYFYRESNDYNVKGVQ